MDKTIERTKYPNSNAVNPFKLKKHNEKIADIINVPIVYTTVTPESIINLEKYNPTLFAPLDNLIFVMPDLNSELTKIAQATIRRIVKLDSDGEVNSKVLPNADASRINVLVGSGSTSPVSYNFINMNSNTYNNKITPKRINGIIHIQLDFLSL